MKSYGYYNGKFGELSEIAVPLTDRALYFGDGIYDVVLGKEGKLIHGDEHIERLFYGASEIGIKHDYTVESLTDIILEVIAKSRLEVYSVYFHLTRNAQKRSHATVNCDGTNLLIIVSPFSPGKTEELSLITFEDRRYGYCYIKTLNLLPSVLASSQAEACGNDEAVFIKDGFVTECSHSNVSIIKNGKLITHPTNGKILSGITRDHMLKAAKRLGIEIEERPFSESELYSADEIIVTSTTKGVARASEINGIRVGMRDEKLFHSLKNGVEFI